MYATVGIMTFPPSMRLLLVCNAQVTAMHNATYAQLSVQYVGDGGLVNSDPLVSVASNVNINLASLDKLGFIVGGQNPNISRYSP